MELVEAAGSFARVLTDVVNGTVSTGVRFDVTPFQGPVDLAWVYPEGSTPAKVALVPARRRARTRSSRVVA